MKWWKQTKRYVLQRIEHIDIRLSLIHNHLFAIELLQGSTSVDCFRQELNDLSQKVFNLEERLNKGLTSEFDLKRLSIAENYEKNS